MMHMFFLAIRVGSHPYSAYGSGCCNLLNLLATIIIMVYAHDLRPSMSCLAQYKDIGCLALLAACAAFGTEAIDATFRGIPPSTEVMQLALADASDNIEFVAFVPALWVGKGFMMESTALANVQKRAVLLCSFLVFFYFTEDVFSAMQLAYYPEYRIIAV